MSQGNSVTVDVSTGSKCHSGRNMGGRNVKAPIQGAKTTRSLRMQASQDPWKSCLEWSHGSGNNWSNYVSHAAVLDVKKRHGEKLVWFFRDF